MAGNSHREVMMSVHCNYLLHLILEFDIRIGWFCQNLAVIHLVSQGHKLRILNRLNKDFLLLFFYPVGFQSSW